MSSATLAHLVSRCRGLSDRAGAVPDAELLRRFVRSRDADAFAELLSRHAGLVWGVCRRTLPQEADCEDAFQATFLALARNARSIDPQQPLGAWLHAVAVRVSRRALGRTLRQRTTELPECVGPIDVLRDVSSRDLFRAVDVEIARLPAALRGPLILCCIEGRARDEAADVLGCSVLAVKARLERGRLALRQALTRRGIALPAAFFAIGVGASRVEANLKERAIQTALGSASPAVAQLAAAGVPAHFSLIAFALIAVVAVGVGIFGFHQGQPKDTPPAAKEALTKADEPKPRVDRFGDPLPDGAVRRFGTLRFRHESADGVAFTSDGKRLVAGVGRKPLAVFDPADGRKLGEVGETSENHDYGFVLAPDGKHVFCTGYKLTMFDLETGAKVQTFEAIRCSTVAVSPDGKKVAAAREQSSGEAMIFDAETGKKLADLNLKDFSTDDGGPEVRDLAFSPDGQMVAAIVFEFKEEMPGRFRLVSAGLRLWEATTGNSIGSVGPANDPPYRFAFVPGTKLLVYRDKGGTTHLWDIRAGKNIRTIPPDNKKNDDPFAQLTVAADGKRMALNRRGGEIVVYDLKGCKEVRRIAAGEALLWPHPIALSADGSLLACGRAYGDSAVRVWEVDTGKERLADAGHRGPATLSLSEDAMALVSRGNGQVFHWDLKTGQGMAKPDRKDPDGWDKTNFEEYCVLRYRTPRNRLAIDFGAGQIEVRSRDGSKLIARAGTPKEYVPGFAYSADGRHFAASFQDPSHTVLLWTPETNAEPFRLVGHPDTCQKLTFTHDGKYLIAGAGWHIWYKTEMVFVYDTATGKLVRKLATSSAPGQMLLTADDRTLITGGLRYDGNVRVWDLPTGKELATLVDPAVKFRRIAEPRGEDTSSIGGLALSPDERFLAVLTGVGESSSVSVWDTGLWKLVQAFPPVKPRCNAASLAFARDGRSVFVAYTDSTILEWDLSGQFGQTAIPTPARLDELWRELGDPEKGYAAAWALLDRPADAVAIIKAKVSPAAPLDPAAVKELVRKLGSDVFRERETAGKKLIALGEAVLPLMREAAAGNLPAESKERVDKVIAALTGGMTPDQLRQRRAIAVLEWSDCAEADEHLRKLAAGDPAARLTVEARAALMRRRGKTQK